MSTLVICFCEKPYYLPAMVVVSNFQSLIVVLRLWWLLIAMKRKKTTNQYGNLVNYIPPFDPNSHIPFSTLFVSSVTDPSSCTLSIWAYFPLKHWVYGGHGKAFHCHRRYPWIYCLHILFCSHIRFTHMLFFPRPPWFLFHQSDPMNPNFVLQIIISINLCEAFLGIAPHFGLWKYLYHRKPRMRDKRHHVVGGASMELRRDQKVDYLDIPLKGNNKGWHYEWFILENHNNSAYSGKQPNLRLAS